MFERDRRNETSKAYSYDTFGHVSIISANQSTLDGPVWSYQQGEGVGHSCFFQNLSIISNPTPAKDLEQSIELFGGEFAFTEFTRAP